MTLSKDDHVIQAIPTDRTDDAFRISVLPRRPRSSDDFVDAEVFGLCVAKSQLRRHGRLIQASTMRFPAVVIEFNDLPFVLLRADCRSRAL